MKIGRSELNDQDPINKTHLVDKLCKRCYQIEDTEHYFLKCPAYEMIRLTMTNKIDDICEKSNINEEDRPKGIEILKVIAAIFENVEQYIIATKRFK